MARPIPENRFEQLLEAATRVFIAQGYRRTQIADVAAEMGVAKGTIYLYVESKEALFAAALRHADARAPLVSELELPLAAPPPAAMKRELEERLAACVNQVPGIRSRFRWEGRVESDDEILLLIKTTAGRYAELEKTIGRLHPYDLPEIIGVRIAEGSAAYLDWITNSTQ